MDGKLEGDNSCCTKIYAVKEFRKRHKNESEKEYVKRLTSEFCISSSLHHVNIVETVDLVLDEKKQWCEVMVNICLICGFFLFSLFCFSYPFFFSFPLS